MTTTDQDKITSRALGGMIGYPFVLICMLIENAGAFLERPVLVLIGWLVVGWLVSTMAASVIRSVRGEHSP